MEGRWIAINLLILVIAVSACVDDSSPTRAIEVSELKIQPSTIYEGGTVTASMKVVNKGNLPAEIKVGSKGENIMTDYCPGMFDISDFSYTTPGGEESPVTLNASENMLLTWTLQQQGRVPTYDKSCDIKFNMRFDYSVNTYKQVQIKKSREVEGSRRLDARSSSGPMFFSIATVGNSVDAPSTFIAPGKKKKETMTIHLQLQNRGREDYKKGVVDIKEESLRIQATEPLKLSEGFGDKGCDYNIDTEGLSPREIQRRIVERKNSCESGKMVWKPLADYSKARCDVGDNEDIRMFEGESRLITCIVPLPTKNELESPAAISEITASVNYTYLRTVGSRRVEVRNRAN